MAQPHAPHPVKLFVGLLSGDVDLLRQTRQLLTSDYGAIDAESERWPFDQTDYYEAEMGPDLERWFLTFERLISPADLAGIKHATNALEQQLAAEHGSAAIARPVNIDPGYLDLSKLVLATTKDAGHRLYIGEKMHGEVTLQYQDGGWQTRPWTYPDFTRHQYHEFFASVRTRYRLQRRAALAAEAHDRSAS